jgi:hypothetical protein
MRGWQSSSRSSGDFRAGRAIGNRPLRQTMKDRDDGTDITRMG